MKKRGKPSSNAAASPPAAANPTKSFEIRFTPDAAADVKSLDGSVRNQLRKALERKLAIDPVAYGLPLRGPLSNFWKHQLANHRIVYRIYESQRIVVICAVGVRKEGDVQDIYRQLDAVIKTGRLADQLASVLRNLIPPK